MWYFNNKIFEPTHDELSSWVGFVYELEDKSNGKKYIGKKLLWSKRRLPPLKGKKRKRVQVKESDWKDYYGSNEEVKDLVEGGGQSAEANGFDKVHGDSSSKNGSENNEEISEEVSKATDF